MPREHVYAASHNQCPPPSPLYNTFAHRTRSQRMYAPSVSVSASPFDFTFVFTIGPRGLSSHSLSPDTYALAGV